MAEKLSGKRALVTGAGTGVGRGIALELAKAGAAVALHYASSKTGAESAVAEIRAGGGVAECFQADLQEISECLRLVDNAAAFLGGLDILVNNAGITEVVRFMDVTPEHFDRLYNVNIRAQVFCAQQAVRHMLTAGKGGAIINISSVHGYSGAPGHAVYAGTKGAILAFTRELGIELGPKGIRVNGVAPGWIEVENHWLRYPGYDPIAGGKRIAAQRVGQPEDIGRACVFLASDDASFVVGQTLLVDGGMIDLMGNATLDLDN